MPNSVPASLRRPFFASFGLLLLLIAGCSSEPRPEKSGGLASSIPDYPAVMSGTENFAEGKVIVEVTLGLPTDFRPGKDGENRSGGSGSHSGHRGGGGRRGGGMGAGGYPGVEGSGAESGSGDDSPRPTVMGSTLPPAQLKLHLKNTSATDAVSCEVTDFNSALGNFAVYPSRYQIDAGQSAVSETMTSRLGVEGSDIPVTVGLKVHDQVEKKIITLHLLPAPSQSTDAPTSH